MPVPVKFEWSETSDTVAFALCVPALSSHQKPEIRTIISPLYIRISVPPYFFEVDLFDEIEDDTVESSLSGAQLVLQLRKKTSRFWKAFCANDNPEVSKESLHERRAASIKAYERKLQERRQKLKERRHDKRETAREEQWRCDSGARQWLETEAERGKTRALQELYSVTDNPKEAPRLCTEPSTCTHPPSTAISFLNARSVKEAGIPARTLEVEDVAHHIHEPRRGVEAVQDRERYSSGFKEDEFSDAEGRTETALDDRDIPSTHSGGDCTTSDEPCLDDSVREKKRITLSFTARRRHRLPARGDKLPPVPKDLKHCSTMNAQMDSRSLREGNSEWLKRKGDKLLKNGDLQKKRGTLSVSSSNLLWSALYLCNISLKIHIMFAVLRGTALSELPAESMLEEALKDMSGLQWDQVKSLQTDLNHFKQ
ncbi:ekn1, related [Neospora caninum Liverpool]|uniref:Ekn1, related n=1 Tax=Neospora caninum (strain Liverpool) TaxID=572307 RepID=F0V7M6_NEOCL|nr:ekn1, related [Neospora caninum Liverpool]CBZ49717.1 ekn1, related [Neospora caninum Liverpool]CEL64301.1 TPA: EKN1, related [Neospora caninum Liverpool]|eukprot:XP_003879752.1 ekn1, related [Neospora caninum Liverpool]